jgi:hypothetical protein
MSGYYSCCKEFLDDSLYSGSMDALTTHQAADALAFRNGLRIAQVGFLALSADSARARESPGPYSCVDM